MADEPRPEPSVAQAPAPGPAAPTPPRPPPPSDTAPEDLQPRKAYPPIETVENAGLTKRDMMSFIAAATAQQGLVGHNIDGYNELAEDGINRIMTDLFDVTRNIKNERTQTESDQRRKAYSVHLTFHDVVVGKPTTTTYMTGQFADLTPRHARLTGIPYSGPVTLGATITVTAHYKDNHVEEKTAELTPFQVGSFPIMVGSSRCHTHHQPREALKGMGEDPTDPGGYFIAKRGEWVVDLLENIRYNSVHIRARMKPNEHVRAEFLSQPGGAFENSSLIRIRYMASGQITVEINSTKFENVQLPFYIIYRLFGLTSDRQIAETVVLDVDDGGPLTAQMLEILGVAFHLADASFAPLVSELDRERLVQQTAERAMKYLTNPNAYLSDENAVRHLNEDLLVSLDRVLLPHIGQDAAARLRKLRFLGLLINKALLVHLKVCQPTDRDSYPNKRVHGAGISLAKAFKTQVNNNVVVPGIRAIRRELRNNPWESITSKSLADAFFNSIATSDLVRAMEQAITAGAKTIIVGSQASRNRVSSQALERKNGLNVVSALRTVVTQNTGNASKQTERADMMRRVHPSYTGFICVAQSADTGESVGMRKQLAITASVCTAGEALPLKLRLLADPAVAPLDAVSGAEMLRRRLARVFVNGEWIGCCESAYGLAARYRALRREGRVVGPHTTICTNSITDEVEFWLDSGRLRRPLLIVDNNEAEYDAAARARAAWAAGGRAGPEPAAVAFVQNVRFTLEHARAIRARRLTLDDLVAEGIAEYVTPEEQENCLIAESIEVLRARRHDVAAAFSHCDVEQAIFGLAALVSPYGNHTQAARVTYQTNQGRQTGGWYAFNWPFLTDKNRFFQFYNSVPLVPTFAHWLIPSNGSNVIVAYASYGGDNQEDSAIVCQASADRGLFAGAFFRAEVVELEKGESFCNPDPLTTKNLKPNASYEKLVDGFVRVGSVVRFGDVLVGRVAKLPRARAGEDSRYLFTDRSVIYRNHEPAVVEEVLRPRGANDELFAVVKYRFERPLNLGDKLCLTPDHEVLTGRGWVPIADVGLGDEVFGRDPASGRLTRARPTALHRYDWGAADGELFEVSGPGVSQLVTPEHRLPVGHNRDARLAAVRELADDPWLRLAPRPVRSPTQDGWPASDFSEADALSKLAWLWVGAEREDLGIVNEFISIVLRILSGVLSETRSMLALIGLFVNSEGIWIHRAALPWLQALATVDCSMVVVVEDLANSPLVRVRHHYSDPHEFRPELRRVAYEGPVHCLSMPGEMFIVRRNGCVSWTGNSSRSGNKCLSGAHRVLARSGPEDPGAWRRIGELVDAGLAGGAPSFELRTPAGWAAPTDFHRYEGCQVYDVLVDAGAGEAVLCRATADHRLALADGSLRQVRDVRPGADAVAPFAPDAGPGGVAPLLVVGLRPRVDAAETTYCFSVPGERFATALPGGPAHWTGNSIVASMLSQSDMPYTESGLTPDLIINTHSFPSRMTIGQLAETTSGKICARKGVVTDGTAFLPIDHSEIADELVRLGYRFNGREVMFNGHTGEHFDAAIFIGPILEQRLQKFVLDDCQVVAGSGPTDATTGQPLGGRNAGALRMGEMERLCLQGHGSMLSLYEKTSTDSDGRIMHVCRGCGSLAIFNEFRGLYQCRTCGEAADIAAVDSTKSAVLFHEECAAAGIRVGLGLRPREFESRPWLAGAPPGAPAGAPQPLDDE